MRRLLSLIPVLILASVLLLNTTAEIGWLQLRWVLIGYVLFGGVGQLLQGYARESVDVKSLLYVSPASLLLAGLLAMVLFLQKQGLGGPTRETTLFAVLLLFVAYLGLHPEQRQFLRSSGVYLLAFAVLLAVFFVHAVPLRPGSGLATFPLLAGFTMGLNLFVFPRYVSRETFLWVVSVLAAIPTVVGLRAYLIGPYEIGSALVDLRGRWELPVVGMELRVLESVFANPNTLGVLAFTGTFGAVAATYRAYRNWEIPGVWVVPLALGVVNGVGLVLSHSRASYLAFGVALGFYVTVHLFGRDVIPYAFMLMVGSIGLFLLGTYLPILGVASSNRFVLWKASVLAILDNPSLLGAGIIDPSEPIARYIEGSARGYSPHNSYLSVFLRVGLLGGAAYLVVTLGSLVGGFVRKERVDIAMLAFVVGFAFHQLFEAYSLFGFSVPAMVGSIVVGYLALEWTLPKDIHSN